MDLSEADGLRFIVPYDNPMHYAHVENPTTIINHVSLSALPIDDTQGRPSWRCTNATRIDQIIIRMEFNRFIPPIIQFPFNKKRPDPYYQSDFSSFALTEENLVGLRLNNSDKWISPDEYLDIIDSIKNTPDKFQNKQIDYDFSKEIAAAAEWWAKTLASQNWKQDNGDEFSSKLQNDLLMRARRESPLTPDQINKFKKELIAELTTAINESQRPPFFVGVDYDPQPLLYDAAINAGVQNEQLGFFPWKTTMSIQQGKVTVRRGTKQIYLIINVNQM